MEKKFKIVAAAAALLLIVSCDGTSTSAGLSTSSGQTSESSLSVSGGGGTTSEPVVSSEPVVEDGRVIIRTAAGITIVPDKETASAGETVTLTVTLESGYSLEKLLLNGKEDGITAAGDHTYTFLMPEGSAVITARLSVAGDVVIQGSAAIVLTKDETTGIYSAENVEISEKAYLTYTAFGTELSVSQIDDTKCFADIDLNWGSDGAFTLAGNAKYSFFYDPANGERPCYIVRTEVLEAPQAVAEFQSLFSGSVRSEPTTWPQNVNKVTYSNSATGDSYVWEDYTSGSLAYSTPTTRNPSVVYKNIDSDIYTVVDTYIEGNGGNGDTTRLDDSSAFSGNYSIVDEVETGYTLYQYTEHDAAFDAHRYSHDIESLDFDIHYGYRTGFDTEYNDSLQDYNISVESVTQDDGSFRTVISSYKNLVPSTTGDSSITEQIHTEYTIDFTFTKAGAPIEGYYSETNYSSSAYDFSSNTFLPGGENMGNSVKEMSFRYEYGDAKAGAPEFDTTPYFISRLDDLRIYNPETDAASGSVLEQNDRVSTYLTFTAYPETALDSWQYGVDASDDLSIVRPRSALEPLTFEAVGTGSVNLTVNNHTSKDVSETVSVSVINTYLVSGFYLAPLEGQYDEAITSSTAYVYADHAKTAHLYARSLASGVKDFVCDFSAESSDESLLKVTWDVAAQTITFDATGVSVQEDTQVTVTITSLQQDPEYPTPTVLTVHILPFTQHESVYCTWNDAADNNKVQLVLKEYEEGDDSTLSSLTVEGTTYTFQITFDEANNRFNSPSGYYSFSGLQYLELIYDSSADQVGVYASVMAEDPYGSGWDSFYEESLLGSGYYDYDSGLEIEEYYWLDRAN